MAIKASQLGISSFILLAILLICMGLSSLNITTAWLVVISLLTTAVCLLNAAHLMGVALGLRFFVLAVLLGFCAEYLGENYGWFFGDYDFTDVLGLKIAGIPIVIPMMWFNLTYMAYVIANILIYRQPVDRMKSLSISVLTSALSAALVTAYDLAADPYLVMVVKAWIMDKTDGWWFGETLQGFVGWFAVSFTIVSIFKFTSRKEIKAPDPTFRKKHALVPFTIFTASMFFYVLFGHPVETRTVALFAMGVPILIALISWKAWAWNDIRGEAL